MAITKTAVARGKTGEKIAVAYLKKQGYTITEQNFRLGHYETDIICENSTHILFVEVKTRTKSEAQERYGRPALAVTKEKSKRLLACAYAYLRAHPTQKQPRLDVIEIYLDENEKPLPGRQGINHIENAITATR